MEEWIESKRIYAGKIVAVRVGEVKLDGGTVAFREIIEHPGGVGIVPVVDDCVALVRQYRIAVGQYVLEIPAGKREGSEEDIEHRARCELQEETGYTAGQLIPVGSMFASVGYTSEEIFLFLAFDLTKVGQNLEFDEQIDVVMMPLDEIRPKLEAGEFKDSKTVVALYALLRHLGR